MLLDIIIPVLGSIISACVPHWFAHRNAKINTARNKTALDREALIESNRIIDEMIKAAVKYIHDDQCNTRAELLAVIACARAHVPPDVALLADKLYYDIVRNDRTSAERSIDRIVKKIRS